MGAVIFGDDVLARERLDLGRIGLHDVHRVAAAARFGDRALHHLIAGGAPQIDLDAIFLLESARQRPRLGRLHRGVEGQLALFLGRFNQPLIAVGALVEIDRGCVLRDGRRRNRHAPWRPSRTPTLIVKRIIVMLRSC